MVQRDSINQDSDHEDKPAYLGKTIAVLHYCFAAGFGFATLALAWLATRAYYQGVSTSFATPLDQTILLGFLSAYCLVFAIVFFLMPSLQSQFPRLRHENRYSLEAMEAQHKKSIRYSRKHRNIVVRHAPNSIRRAVRFCYWTPKIAMVLLIGTVFISKSSVCPSWLTQFHSSFSTMIAGIFRTIIFFIGFFALFQIPQDLLERHARHLYDRHLRRLETNAEHCPGCDYPIDRAQQPECCPECGVAYPA